MQQSLCARMLLLVAITAQCSSKENPCATGYGRNDVGQCVPVDDGTGSGSDTGAGGDYEGDDPGECSDGVDNDRDGLFDCDDPGCAGAPVCSGSTYHPAGFDDPADHGPSAKLQQESCAACHGGDLRGGTGGSCDDCHPSDWRTDCTFCHGGEDNTTGAPPRDIDGSADPVTSSFRPHSAHVEDTEKHKAFSCAHCHEEPLNVMTPGHLFVNDDTPASAELDFSSGQSPEVEWNGTTCSDVYCHGNGQGANGVVRHDATSMDCQSCHPNRGSESADIAEMSGAHLDHSREEIGCEDCHADTVDTELGIVGLDKHVNRTIDVVFSSASEGMTWTGESCTGGCHSHSESWSHGGP